MQKFYFGCIAVLILIIALLCWQLRDTGSRLDAALRNNESIREYQQQVIAGLETISTGINSVSNGVKQVSEGVGDVKNRLGSNVDSIAKGSELIKEQRGILEKVRKRN